MPLTSDQKFKIKKHLNFLPSTTILNGKFDVINADSSLLTYVSTQITLCDTRFATFETQIGSAGKVTSGFGAKLDEDIPISKKQELYINAVEELCRLIEFPRNPFAWENGGANAQVSGFLGGLGCC